MAEASKHPYSRVMAWWSVGFLTLCQGDLPQAILVLERALALVQGGRPPTPHPHGGCALGGSLCPRRPAGDAVPLWSRPLQAARGGTSGTRRSGWSGWARPTYARAGGPGGDPGAASPGVGPGPSGTGPRGPRPVAPREPRRRAILWRLRPLKRITDKRSPSPTTSACASRPTATAASAHGMP